MSKIVNVIQGSPEWLQHRATHFNASDAPAMLGISSYKSRSDLLKEKATGITGEVDAQTQARFDRGHELEAIARPLAEEIIGEELYPVVLADEVEGLPLSASVDGLTMTGEVAFEHKTLNQSLAASLEQGIIPDEYHPQMEQQLLLSGAERCLFMASAGDKESMRFAWYESKPELRKQLIDGWKQFEKDLADYTSPEVKPEVVGRAPETLPALRIEVTGMVTASNLAEFKETALAVFGAINTDLQTDNDFADAERTVKWCKEVEDRLDAAKQHALSQTADIDELFRTIDAIREEARSKRLQLDKLVTERKKAIKFEIAQKAKAAFDAHVAQINQRLELVRLPEIPTDFNTAMKGKKTVATLQAAADDELARAKIAANAKAEEIDANLRTVRELGKDHQFLFADLQQLVLKSNDDLQTLIKARITEHEAAERRRLEAERERIRQEEQRKLEAEQRAKQQAESAARREAEVAAQRQRTEQPLAQETPTATATPSAAPRGIRGELYGWQDEHSISDKAMAHLLDILLRHGALAQAA